MRSFAVPTRVLLVTCILVFVVVIFRILRNEWEESSVIVIKITSKNQDSRNSREQNIRDAIGTRNVADYIKKNSIRLNWHTNNLALKIAPIAIIMVISIPEAKIERMAIRETWYKFSDFYNVKIVFFMGIPQNGELRNIVLESAEYDDIVLDDFPDDFHKLSIKVLRMFKWFIEFYRDSPVTPKYLIKVDQDVFLHVPNVVQHLESLKLTSNEHYIGGRLYVNASVIRRIKSKHFVPLDIYDKFKYPPFLGGSCYFLSTNLVAKIFHASFEVPLFHLENIYISGMVVHEKLGIQLHGLEEKAMVESSKSLQAVIKYKNNIWNSISYHSVDPPLMKYLYNVARRHVQTEPEEIPLQINPTSPAHVLAKSNVTQISPILSSVPKHNNTNNNTTTIQ